MSTYYLSFDTPVSTNRLYSRSRRGVRLSDEARNWKQYAALMALQQWEGKSPLSGQLCVTYRFFGSRLDVDNGIKILQDSMNNICWFDDSQIIQLHVYMFRKEKDDPRVDVEIQTLG